MSLNILYYLNQWQKLECDILKPNPSKQCVIHRYKLIQLNKSTPNMETDQFEVEPPPSLRQRNMTPHQVLSYKYQKLKL